MNIQTITQHYLIAALWSTVDYETGDHLDDNYSLSDVSSNLQQSTEKDVKLFIELSQPIFDKYKSVVDEFYINDEQIGHDLLLTRNGHGAGFWDRSWGNLGDELTSLVNGHFKEVNLFVNDDTGLIDIV